MYSVLSCLILLFIRKTSVAQKKQLLQYFLSFIKNSSMLAGWYSYGNNSNNDNINN